MKAKEKSLLRQPHAQRDSSLQSQPTVAVIVPVYNGSRYLSEALSSVMAQTVRPDEVIVVDDGSTDATVALAKSFPDVRVIEQKNSGVSVSRNRGIREATSEWIAFLDHDDLWLPAKLQEQMAVIAAQPDSDLVVTGKFDYVWEKEGDRFVQGQEVLPPIRHIGRRLYGPLRFGPSCVMVRRSVLQDVGGFDPTVSQGEDWDLWIRLEQAGIRFAACPKPLVLYRVHTSNCSKDGRRMYEGELRIFRSHIAPRTAAPLRPFRALAARSRFMAGFALVQREQEQPCLRYMLLSLLWWPFGYWKRYKVAAHMLLTHFTRNARQAS